MVGQFCMHIRTHAHTTHVHMYAHTFMQMHTTHACTHTHCSPKQFPLHYISSDFNWGLFSDSFDNYNVTAMGTQIMSCDTIAGDT